MSVEVSCSYLGDLSVRAIHGPSQSEIKTTAPVDSPTDLLATALGTCTLTIMGKVAKNNDIDLKGASVKVEKSMNSDPRRLKKLRAEFTLPERLSSVERKKMEAAAKTCPVKPSLHPEVEVEFIFNYRD
jgi:putative redox protein